MGRKRDRASSREDRPGLPGYETLPTARDSRYNRTPKLSKDTEACMRVLESSLGRPANPNVTARDLDSMLADYVDENEDSVELVRSVRDGA